MRVLVFGDSITQGYWDTEGGWVNRLRQYYDEIQSSDLQQNDEPTVFNLGISADTSREILARAKTETLARTRHKKPIVVIQIGINDSCKHAKDYQVAIEEYKNNLQDIINELKAVSSELVFVGHNSVNETRTSPVFWGDYWYSNKDIKEYEDAMEEVAKDNNVPFIAVFNEFFDRVEKQKTVELIPDGLRPNNEGHKVLLEIIKPKISKYLV